MSSLKVRLVVYHFLQVIFDWNNQRNFSSEVPTQAIVLWRSNREFQYEVATRIPGRGVPLYSCPLLFLFFYFRLFYQYLIVSEPVVRISLHGVGNAFALEHLNISSPGFPSNSGQGNSRKDGRITQLLYDLSLLSWYMYMFLFEQKYFLTCGFLTILLVLPACSFLFCFYIFIIEFIDLLAYLTKYGLFSRQLVHLVTLAKIAKSPLV